jgi:acetolactate synthase-1/2/3 large subunit
MSAQNTRTVDCAARRNQRKMVGLRAFLAEALVRTLRVAGVRRVFGVPGGYTSGLLDALSRSETQTVRSMHEGAAAFAAAGYAQASGELAVTFAQSGPGATNLLTGVAAAFMDSVPMLVLASQAATTEYGQDGHQEVRGLGQMIDQLEVFRTAAGQLYRPPTGAAALRCVRQAISLALAERTPAVIDLAVDVAGAPVEFVDLAAHQFITRSHAVDHEAVRRVAEMIGGARTPVLLVGDRIAHRGCTAKLAKICEEHDVAIVCADFAKGVVPEDHPLFAGVLGQSGHESAAELVRASDLVIALGTRMSVQTTVGYEPGLFAHLVQVEERASEIARNYPVALGVVSHLPGFVEALIEQLGARGADRGMRARVAALRTKHATYAEDIARRDELNTPTALRILREKLPRETLVAGDCGLNLQYIKRHFPIYAPDGFFNLYGLAAMGAALPVGLGVKLARPTTPVVTMIGDGGLMVYPGELAVAAELGASLVTIVMNNRGYLQVGDRLERYFGTRHACGLPEVDFVKLAESMGVLARRATDPGSLGAAIEWALAQGRPTLIDVVVSGDNLLDMTLPQTRVLQDRLFKRDPLRPPWPFPPEPADS